MSVHKKVKAIRSSRLAGYWEHMYECFFYFKKAEGPSVCREKKIKPLSPQSTHEGPQQIRMFFNYVHIV